MMMPFNPFLFPCVPSLKPMRPPLLYDLLNSIVNFGVEEQTKISNLSEKATEKIFDFSYPLSPKVNKKDFEKRILNHFIMRRIGYETFTLWKIAFETKLNDIMPDYNILFEALSDWNLFKDGESSVRSGTDNTKINTTSELSQKSNSHGTSDRRMSEMPQNNINEVKSGNYLTNYNYDENNSNDTSNSNGNSDTKNDKEYREEISKDISNKLEAYNNFKQNREHIMNMIYQDLDELFYSIID